MSGPVVVYAREKTRDGKLGLSTKIAQAIGAVPDTLKTFAFGSLLLFYYNQVLGLPAGTAALAIAVALVIDAALDPIIGSWSDNLKSRLGRRHPLMYASAAPLGLALYLVFSPPAVGSQTLLAIWLFATVVATNISMSLFMVPWTALYAELSDDYDERTQIVTWRYAVGWLAGMGFVFVTWSFIFPSSPAYTPGQLNPHGYAVFAPVLASATFGAVIATTYLTRGEIPFLLQPVGDLPRFSVGRVWRDLSSALGNVDFLVLFASSLLSAGISGTLATLTLYVQTYFWGLTPEQLRWFSFALLGALMAFFLVGRIERQLDKKQALLVSFLLLIVDGIVMIALRLAGWLPANGDARLIALLVVNAITGTFLLTIVAIMFVSMLADTIDLQELRTGRRQEGVFAAALTFSNKATAGIGALVAGFLLDRVIHWPAKAAPGGVAADRVISLGVVGGLLVPCLLLAPALLIARYRITRGAYEATREQLGRRRVELPACTDQ